MSGFFPDASGRRTLPYTNVNSRQLARTIRQNNGLLSNVAYNDYLKMQWDSGVFRQTPERGLYRPQ